MTYSLNIFTQKLTLNMNWIDFITEIENGLFGERYSDQELGQFIGTSREVIFKIKNGSTKSPRQSTIQKLSKAFKIKIDATDKQNIVYKPLIDLDDKSFFEKLAEKMPDEFWDKLKVTESTALPIRVVTNKYPIVTEVFAGESMSINISENTTEFVYLPYNKKDNCFAVKVNGNSMNGVIHDGEIALADMDQPLINDCVVIVRLKDGRQLIKRYRALTDEMVMFSSDSPGYQPIVVRKEEIEAIYKVVGSWRRF